MCYDVWIELPEQSSVDWTFKRRNVYVLYKDSVRTALWTLATSVIKTQLLVLYKAKVTVCYENT